MILQIAVAEKLTFMELLMKGGWLMIPLFLLSLVSIYILFERYFYIRAQNKLDHTVFDRLKDLLFEGKVDAAKALCSSMNTSESRILLKGIQNIGKPLRDIRELMEMEGKLEVYKYENNVYFLGVIAGIAPMLGFIGTIMGVIKIFYNISLADNFSISLISGGLYEKLLTSGTGLSIGIIAYLSYHYLNNRINKMVQNWEYFSVRFIDAINTNKL